MAANVNKYMEGALREAKGVKGSTFPNPAVGAVLVKNGKIIARGATQPPGSPHAEVIALKKAGKRAKGTTLFVTLEPCCHHGRTPPCTDAILTAGVAKVVVGVLDPNPKVRGKGLRILQKAGVEVDRAESKVAAKIEEFYGDYFFFVNKGRPRIFLKIAQSLEGNISAGPRKRTAISGKEALKFGHQLREGVDAVLIGGATARADSPGLTIRAIKSDRKIQPQGIIVSESGRLGKSNTGLFSDNRREPLIFTCSPSKGKSPRHILLKKGNKNPIPEVLSHLTEMGYHSILVEGGAKILGWWLQNGVWDAFYVLQSSISLPRGISWSEGLPANWQEATKIGRFITLKNEAIWEFLPKKGNK